MPEVDEVAAEWNFNVGDAECDFAERDLDETSPWSRLLAKQSKSVELALNFRKNYGCFSRTGDQQRVATLCLFFIIGQKPAAGLYGVSLIAKNRLWDKFSCTSDFPKRVVAAGRVKPFKNVTLRQVIETFEM